MGNLSDTTANLESLFSKLNHHYYNNKLSIPVITISPDTTKGAYGWCTCEKIWQETSESITKRYEINIYVEYLARPFEEVATTMLHLYNLGNGIKDTSRSGTYHNKKFKETAEKHGLIIGKDVKYVCPKCGDIIRATKEVHVMCLDCKDIFRLEKPKD